MTTSPDTYWKELGTTWTATEPDIAVIMPHLKRRLRRQSLLITLGLVIGLPLTLAGLVLGVFTLWIGVSGGAWNFVIRGSAVILLALMAGRALLALVPVRNSDAGKPLSAMLDLAIARARRTLLLIRLGLYASLVAAVFGMAGTAVRTYLSGPPQLSPAIDLLLLAMFALTLVVVRGHVQAQLTKLTVLSKLLATG